jgi:hypothetical protein
MSQGFKPARQAATEAPQPNNGKLFFFVFLKYGHI